MLNFWSDETRLPSSTFDRLTAMLEAMYTPTTEMQYLSYATNLLLEMTSKSPDFNREIFEYPLSDCTFQVRLRPNARVELRIFIKNVFAELVACALKASFDGTHG